jgi:aspartyl-tRNA synthetase
MRFLVVGDLHGNKPNIHFKDFDAIIAPGDFCSDAHRKNIFANLKKHGVNIEKDDLSQEAERKLDEVFPETIVFVHDWPMSGKPFYIMPKDERFESKISEGFDAIYRGMEISSGGQRIHLPDLLEKRIKAKGMNPRDFKSYIDSFRFGAPPHAGWSIGIERFTQVLLRLNNAREAVLFPRDRDRLTP